MPFFQSKQQLVVLKILRENELQEEGGLRIKLTELQWKGGQQHKSGIIKIHIGGSPNWILENQVGSMEGKSEKLNQNTEKRKLKTKKITCENVMHKKPN